MTTNSTLENLAKKYGRYYAYIEPIVSDPLVRGYFNLVASFLLMAFFLVFALSPTINTILTLQKKITEQRRIVKALDQKIANLVTAQANYSQIESSLPILLAALPERPTPQTIIFEITAMASSSGLVLSGLQFQNLPLSADSIATAVQTQKKPGALKIAFTLNLSGTADKVHDFLTKIENLPRQIHIIGLGMAKDQKNPKINSSNISAEGYYLPENK